MSTMLHGCFADTDYFEVRSGRGLDYGVWVTTPPNYESGVGEVPVVYVLDGNWTVGLTAPLIVTQHDPMQRIKPYIQVSVGYAGEEAAEWASLRNRDLVPPGEPVAQEFLDAVELGVRTGAMSREQADAHVAELRDTRADEFLGFLTSELHHRIERDYGTAEGGHGLFGYSYGGLFSLYAWLAGASLFESVGAGSPGVASADSRIFEQIEALGERSARLHLTVNDRELLGEVPIYQNLAKNAATVLHMLTSRGAAVSGEVLRETHVTGLQSSFLSYLRACRAV
ncbi:alpha/beta hydrolase [Actinosynnema pretiosum subsp. pretiosum]|uniref:Alpha/beta hydrolase n=2 Tax=Actinosynnema TaxID=40566 RepID=A0AA45L7H2_9PSEU|nr:alpha/beta hydrolase-fold protein [Actinosynnema mirum]ACU37747.1 putative esterase [Actinosynnema mirum DSM 43827]AXX31175.1 putative esterase [Actinosynnema pretiosum subsp. pretiosum]QUF04751.1 alpha/beta hydrolase [Actinosynnema pretiosum subsp. pretiosum]